MFAKVLPIVIDELDLKSLPKIKLVKNVPDDEQPTFGKYENGRHVLYLGINNRHPIDIFRTFSHEMVHYKQDLLKHLGPNSGDTGSPEENEAHAVAGVIMRRIDKQYPEFLNASPIVLK